MLVAFLTPIPTTVNMKNQLAHVKTKRSVGRRLGSGPKQKVALLAAELGLPEEVKTMHQPGRPRKEHFSFGASKPPEAFHGLVNNLPCFSLRTS